MDASRWDKLNDLFQTAAELVGDKRKAFITAACGSDFELFQQLNRLLNYHESKVDTRFDVPIVVERADLATEPDNPMIGRQIRQFQIERLIGRGGFGDVYLATRSTDFSQKVAIKILHDCYRVNETILRRFEVERQLLADLSHPNIARLLDGGTTDDGRPYIVMEYVSGQNVIEFCMTQKLDLRQRLKLLLQVSNGVAYAHQYGIVHRDIKPANILVDRHQTPKLVDFGIAKLTDLRSLAESLTLTRHGLLPLTPQYASPEQFTSEPATPASDVYSLGVVVYELVTGSPPHVLSETDIGTLIDVISTHTPLKPTQQWQRSQRMLRSEAAEESTAAAPASSYGRRWTRSSSRSNVAAVDLDKVVMMALRKEPMRRYPDASAFAADIHRLLNGEAVAAQGDSVRYRVRRFTKRNRAFLPAACVILLSVAAIAITAVVARRSVSEGRTLIAKTQSRVQQYEHSANIERAFAAFERMDYRGVREILRRAGPDIDENSLEVHLLSKLTASSAATKLDHRAASVNEVAVVPGKPWVVTVGDDRQLLVWNTDTGDLVKKLGECRGPLQSVAVSMDGVQLAVGREELGDGMSEIELWDLKSLQFLRVVHRCLYVPESLAFSPDGRRLAIGTRYHEVFVVDLASSEVKSLETDSRYWTLAFLPDGSLLVPVQRRATPRTSLEYVAVFDEELREVDVFQPSSGPARENIFALSRSGALLATTGERDSSLTIYDTQTRRQLARIGTLADRSSSVAISPDEDYVAVGFFDGTVRVWALTISVDLEGLSVGSLTPTFQFQADPAYVTSLQFTDKSELVSSGADASVEIWPQVRSPALDWIGPPAAGPLLEVDVSDDGQVVVLERTGRLWLRDKRGEWVPLTKDDGQTKKAVSITPVADPMVFAVRNELKVLRGNEWDPVVFPFRGEKSINGTAISGDGTMVAAVSYDPLLSVFDLSSGEEILTRKPDSATICVAFSIDDEFVACGGVSGKVQLFSIQTAQSRKFNPTQAEVTSIAWSGEGDSLASGHYNGEIWLHKLRAEEEPLLLRTHSARVAGLVFSPDGKTLLSSGWDGSVLVWQVATGRLLGTLYDGQAVISFRANADGRSIYLVFDGVSGTKAVQSYFYGP